MPDNGSAQEPDTLARNFRLVATPWPVFACIINPLLAMFAMFYIVTHLQKDRFLLQFFIGFSLPFIALFVAMHTGKRLKARLEAAGRTMRRTQQRDLDLLLNYAVCGGTVYWLQHQSFESQTPWVWLYVVVVLYSLSFTGFVFLGSLGPLIWYTVRED